jgi:hypothetical protein
MLMPIATYTGRLATVPSRTFSTIASIRITGYTGSSGRDCQAFISPTTASMTLETSSADLGVVHLGQVGGDVAGGHSLGVNDNHGLIEPGQAPLMLGNHGRLERPGPVPGHRQRDLTDIGADRLWG